jgi:hypothetical protein
MSQVFPSLSNYDLLRKNFSLLGARILVLLLAYRGATGWTTVVRFLAEARVFFSIPQRTDQLWAYPAYHPMGIGGAFSGQSGQGVKLTTYLHIIENSGAIPSFKHTSSSNRVSLIKHMDNSTVYF